MDIKEFIEIVKRKREYKDVDDSIITYILREVLKLDLRDSKNVKETVKEVRKILHNIYGVYFDRLKKIKTFDVEEVLKLSKPTRERLPFYTKIYSWISIDRGSRILDIASGLNPASIFLDDTYKKIKEYIAIDISRKVCEILKLIFDKYKFNGKCFIDNIFDPKLDIYNENFDYVFLWKTIPIIEKYKPKYTMEFLKVLNSRFLIVSFPRKSLGKRRYMGRAWARWCVRLCSRVGWEYLDIFEIPNEVFIKFKKE